MYPAHATCDELDYKMLTLLLLLATLPVLDAQALARLRSGEAVVGTNTEGSAGEARGWIIARCKPARLWVVLTDHARFPEFIPHLKAVEIVRQTGDTERLLQTVDAVVTTVHYGLDYRYDQAALRIEYQLAEDLPHDIAAARGSWQLTAVPEGTLIEYTSAVDAGRPVPGFIRRYLAERSLEDVLVAVRNRALSR
jgi:hypothetical protein